MNDCSFFTAPARQPGDLQLPVLIELYKKQCAHGRHIEWQRQAIASLLFTAGGALVAVKGPSILTAPARR
jgi:hypothetical protein